MVVEQEIASKLLFSTCFAVPTMGAFMFLTRGSGLFRAQGLEGIDPAGAHARQPHGEQRHEGENHGRG